MRNEREKQIDEQLATLTPNELKDINNSPKYLPLSPSLIELSSDDDPDKLSVYDHIIAMQASIRGVVGHTFDTAISEIYREGIKNGSLDSIRKMGDNATAWLTDWKSQHEFVKKEGRKESNRYLEGEKVKAATVEKYWNSDGLASFERDVLEANLREIKDRHAPFPINIQRDPNLLIFPEAGFTNIVKFKHEKAMYTARRDYLIFDPSQKQIIIIDNKFSMPKEENEETRELQALLYSLFAKQDLEALLGDSESKKPTFFDAHSQNLNNILFYYRHLERGRNIFHYELYDPKKLNNPYTWGRLYEFLDKYRANYRKLRDLKERKDRAYVLPRISDQKKVSGENIVQTNMFGVIYESTS